MAGGAVSGAILGAIDGGLNGALKGAAWGAGIGGILGAGYVGFESIGLGGAFLATVAVGGAAYAATTGGLEGLGDYAAGVAGAFYGGSLGNALTTKGASVQTPAGQKEQMSDAKTQDVERLLRNFVEVETLLKEQYGQFQGKLLSDQAIAKFGSNPSPEAIRNWFKNLPSPTPKANSVNWKAVGIGVGEVIFGIGAVVSSVAAGTAATAASGGTAFAPAVIYAGGGVSTGFALFALGMGEIANGLNGNRSVTVEALRIYYNSAPPEVTLFDVFQ
ncbi:MAG: hypothetical protein ISS26_06185 [Candidatus Omnitrophica bacterium]|nr:hypothetical protein [Candidatus Omnitrophota bacterium]